MRNIFKISIVKFVLDNEQIKKTWNEKNIQAIHATLFLLAR